jgi:thioredoxin reductase (NADPH)
MAENLASPVSPPPWSGATDDRREQMFPTLSAAQIAELMPFGAERVFDEGQVLWNIGARNVDFFIVLEGTLEIVRRDAFGADTVIVSHGPGRYSGETAMLTGRGSMVCGRAGTHLRVLAIPIERLREVMLTHARLGELIMRSFILRRMRMISERSSDLLLVGSRHSAGTLQLQDFLTRNGHPYTFVDLETADDVCALLNRCDIRPQDTPMIITSRGDPLRNPSLREVADRLGISLQWDPQTVHDVAVVGAGPAGLASAVYAASEGLDVIVLEPIAPGGQAGTSSKIENYLGFPTGISGGALAGRAFMQAQKFGAKIVIPARLTGMSCGNPYHELELEDGERIRSRTIVIASGAQYRKPALSRLRDFEGAGIYYGATYLEAQFCRDEEVAIIGGGNSAGQAAVFLSETAKKVYVLVRSEGLAASMSRYLIRRIETTPNIELRSRCEIAELQGESYLESVCWRNRDTDEVTLRPVKHLFVFIGAVPNTAFLPAAVATDANGFVCTGAEVSTAGAEPPWTLERPPFPLETSCPGVFAAGDVRASSTKRVASAVGEGSVVVQYIHQLLAASVH